MEDWKKKLIEDNEIRWRWIPWFPSSFPLPPGPLPGESDWYNSPDLSTVKSKIGHIVLPEGELIPMSIPMPPPNEPQATEMTAGPRRCDLSDVFGEIDRLKKNIDRYYFGNLAAWQIGKFHQEITRIEVALENFRDDHPQAMMVLEDEQIKERIEAEEAKVRRIKAAAIRQVADQLEQSGFPIVGKAKIDDALVGQLRKEPAHTLEETQEMNRQYAAQTRELDERTGREDQGSDESSETSP